MNRFSSEERQRNRNRSELFRSILVVSAVFILSLFCIPSAWGQSAESADITKPSVWAGGGISGYRVQYGARKMWGATAFVDADSAHHIGVEGEGRWLEFHQTANVHLETYMIGPRYHLTIGKFHPFAKGVAGFGNFNFSYNYAYGTYFVYAIGGGLDYDLNRRWSVRVAELQYEDWPQFTYGVMSNVGISSGIRWRIF